MEQKFEVHCSPNMTLTIKEETDFLEIGSEEMVQQSMFHYDENDDIEIFSPSMDADSNPLSTMETKTNSPDLVTWTDTNTKLLLTYVKDLYGKVGKSSILKSKAMLWQTIAENLAQEGYGFSPAQVESKFRGLLRQYKKVKLNGDNIRSRATCIYLSELEEILGHKYFGHNPKYTLDSESQDTTVATGNAESKQETVDESPPTKVKDKDERGKLLAKLEEISQQKEQRHKSFLAYLKKKELKKIEREQRREEFNNRIIGLLEKLVNKSK